MKIVNNKILTLVFTTLAVFTFLGCGSEGIHSDDTLVGGNSRTVPDVASSYGITAHHGSAVVVHSHVSSSSNSAAHTHQWTQVAGPTVTLSSTNNPTTTFVSPAQTGLATVPIVLQHTVTHAQTGQATVAFHTINHIPATGNLSIKVSSPVTIFSGDKASLHVGVIGGDGNYKYTWIQSSGPSVNLNLSHPSSPTFTAPSVSASETLVFEVTVTDGTGSKISASETVTVKPRLVVPPGVLRIQVKIPTHVNEGTTFVVGAIAIGPTGPYTYKWESLAPNVGKIVDPSLRVTKFETNYQSRTRIVYAKIRLTVTDAKGVSKPSFIETVEVHNVRLRLTVAASGGTIAPSLHPGLHGDLVATVKAGEPLTLTGTAHGGSGKYAYAWQEYPMKPFTLNNHFTLSGAITQAIFDSGNLSPSYRVSVVNTVAGVDEKVGKIIGINVIAP